MPRPAPGERRRAILEALAAQLEAAPGSRVTTAALAAAVGVSEAALYRHFPSKARMYDELIGFVEESLFGLINQIMNDQVRAVDRCDQILALLLGFAEKNPGISRILAGDALVGEVERLRARVEQLFRRLETQLKQVLREGVARQEMTLPCSEGAAASLLLSVFEGRLARFVRSDFERLPTDHWPQQWQALQASLF
ncbi:MAG: nucleoid occlusion factor SlmA [Gammaproteobacteria bacterium]|nr:nucleoid occlusion factor SlmA [Gammaproteobacteria bacterium]